MADFLPPYQLLTHATPQGPRAGVLVKNRVFDAAELTGVPAYAAMQGILDDWAAAEALIGRKVGSASGASLPLSEVRLLAPVPRPGAIYCVGANYQDHVDAIGRKFGNPPEPEPHSVGLKPFFFLKTSHCAVATGVPVALAGHAFDYEVELAAVIGRTSRNLPVERALEAVAAYTVANDLSARDRISREAAGRPFQFDWVGHKVFDGACPIGPWLTPASAVADPQALRLNSWVNGEMRQDGSTGQMLFTLAEQIAHLTSRLTLYPGDIVMTGTPAGVAAETGRFLKAGDVVRVAVEGLGELTTPVVAA